MMKFIDYLRHRSLGLFMILILLIADIWVDYPTMLVMYIAVIVIFVLHSYKIYKQEKGVKNSDLLRGQKEIEKELENIKSHLKEFDPTLDLILTEIKKLRK